MEALTINESVQIISSVGFPVFVAIWLLYYGKKQQEDLRNALTELKLEVQLTRNFIEQILDKESKKEGK